MHGQVKTNTWEHEGKTHRRDIVVVSDHYGAVGAWLRFATAQPRKTTRTTATNLENNSGKGPEVDEPQF